MKVAWLSGGVSSFIAAYLAEVDRAVYINVANQHPDTLRFLAECATHLTCPIEIIGDTDYGQSVDKVIERRRYINGPAGAQCTTLLKKRVRQAWERRNCDGETTYVWGFDSSELKRAERTRLNSEFACEFPLIERGIDKAQCHGMIARLGVELPAMYRLGYPNNNCVGCVKGGMGYWNKIREDFPDVFARRAYQDRAIGHSCINGVYLDQLEPGRGVCNPVVPECGLICGELDAGGR